MLRCALPHRDLPCRRKYCILQNELCQHLIVPELATLAAPTSQEEIRAYTATLRAYNATLRANVAAHIACMM